jgi:hypothetical protein
VNNNHLALLSPFHTSENVAKFWEGTDKEECTINPLKLPCPPVYMVCTSPVAGTSSVSVLQPHWRVLVSTSRILSLSTWSSNMLLANEQCKEVKGVWPVLRMLYSHTRAFSMVLRCASRFVRYNFATNQTTNTATCHQAPLPLSNHHNGPLSLNTQQNFFNWSTTFLVGTLCLLLHE